MTGRKTDQTKDIKNGWTRRRKKRRAADARRRKLWEKSTGPKTDAGKEVSKYNGVKHGLRSAAFTDLAKALRDQKDFLDRIESADKAGMDYAPGLEFAGQVGDDERHD